MRASRPAPSTPASPRTSSQLSGRRSPKSTRTTSPASRTRPLPRELLFLALIAAGAVLVVYLLAVQIRWGQELDERVLLGSEILSDPRAAQADRFLRIVSVGTLALATVLVAALAFFRERPRTALIAAGSIAAAVVCTELLKLVILERPPLNPTELNLGDNSYPSGHTTVGTAVCVAVLLVVPDRLRWPTAIGAGLVSAAFGVAVVAAGWHRPSDAVGAFLVCLAVGAVAGILTQTLAPEEAARRERDRAGPSLTIGTTEVALGALVLGLAAVVGIAALAARGVPFFSVGVAFVISSLAIAAIALASTTALAWAMDRADET